MRTFSRVAKLVVILVVLVGMPIGAAAEARSQVFQPVPIPVFAGVWEGADGPVSRGEVSRSWLWGPSVRGQAYEFYLETPSNNGQRFVQYFDKARMEETDPSADPGSPWYVTTGLLVREMVSGRIQAGNDYFFQRSPSVVPVAGDLDSRTTPRFADFASVATLDGVSNTVEDRIGQVVSNWMSVGGEVTPGNGPEDAVNVAYVSETGHNIPDVFWNWMNDPASGVSDNPTGNWVYVMGYPITEAYWINAPLAGVDTPMLVQLYERRAVTYTPSNSPAWRVEMGNVGLQYLQWQNPLTNEDVAWSLDSKQLAFLSNPLGNWDITVADAQGGGSRVLAGDPFDQLSPIWQTNGRVAFIDGRDYTSASMNVEDGSATWFDMWYPTPSPNEARLAYIDGFGQLLVDDQVVEGAEFVIGDSLSWSADSSTLLYTRSVEIDKGYYANVVFTYREGVVTQAFPRRGDEASWLTSGNFLYDQSLSPDGQKVVLSIIGEASSELRVVDLATGGSVPIDLGMNPIGADWGSTGWIVFRGANGALWMIEDVDPSTILPISVAPVSDWDPVWSPDGNWIAFERDAGTGSEIWVVNPFVGEWHKIALLPTRP